MDSGNSSSMQCSSGDDDANSKDADSKAESSMSMPMPLFLDHHTLSVPSYYNLNNAFLPSSLMFETDYLPNAAYSSHPQLLQNPTRRTRLILDTFIPDANCTDGGGLPASTSSSRQNMAAPHGLEYMQRYQPSSSAAATTTNEPMKVVKNPRKRTRASRRAPTTILTTDTENFRAMVQEFTGFPAPPFSGSRKLDLFGSGSIFRMNPRGPDLLGHMNPLRPSAQKFQNPHLMADTGNTNPDVDVNSIIGNALMSTITSSIAQTAANGGPATDSNAGAAPSLLNLPKHSSQNHQNPIPLPNSNTLFTFPSLLHDHQAPLNTPTSGLLRHFGTEDDPSPQDHFGAKLDRQQGRTDTSDGNKQGRWFDDGGYCRGSSKRANRNGGYKMNYTAAASSSSDHHRGQNNDKGLQSMTTTTRGEGATVDNWFGSSD
ncbi:hypothetical protein MLD38_034784 [Melastoma candidum]|uniref:Uncharacterized protein n=1 Tax=Melastoma candidum TaxID=119954 RepID=A0ACB9MB53_9MYRT|nr:hypothetical protein MLD38_034784 [Melastoma candidum]